jgi:hypothetical protein
MYRKVCYVVTKATAVAGEYCWLGSWQSGSSREIRMMTQGTYTQENQFKQQFIYNFMIYSLCPLFLDLCLTIIGGCREYHTAQQEAAPKAHNQIKKYHY